jgi:hypothetical protein
MKQKISSDLVSEHDFSRSLSLSTVLYVYFCHQTGFGIICSRIANVGRI